MITPAEIITLGIVLIVVDVIVVALRFHVKRTKAKSVALNDYLILLSLVSSEKSFPRHREKFDYLLNYVDTGSIVSAKSYNQACACTTAAMIIYGAFTQGYGRVSPPAVFKGGLNANSSPEISETRHLTYSFLCISIWTYGLTKLSVLLFYRSIFIDRLFNRISMIILVLTCVWILTSFFVQIFQCRSHVAANWTDPAYIAKHCFSGFAIGIATASTDVFTDLLILVLPIYWVLKLNMSLKKRLSIIGVFLFGALAIASSIGRLIAVSTVYPNHNKSPNQFAFMTTLIYFGQLEAALCIIAACLPTLGPLLFPNRSKNRRLRRVRHTYEADHSFQTSFGFRSKETRTPEIREVAQPQTSWCELNQANHKTKHGEAGVHYDGVNGRTLDNELQSRGTPVSASIDFEISEQDEHV